MYIHACEYKCMRLVWPFCQIKLATNAFHVLMNISRENVCRAVRINKILSRGKTLNSYRLRYSHHKAFGTTEPATFKPAFLYFSIPP